MGGEADLMSVLPPVKPYLYIEELATLTPWSVEAIRKKVQRGELQRGRDYFQEARRDRWIFKWAAIVERIENLGRIANEATAGAPERAAEVIDVEEATERLRRLHR